MQLHPQPAPRVPRYPAAHMLQHPQLPPRVVHMLHLARNQAAPLIHLLLFLPAHRPLIIPHLCRLLRQPFPGL